MRIELTPPEARVIGCLLEKEITTPAQYPLSLSALTTACNQKSSREPVMHLSDTEVEQIVDGLIKKHLVAARGDFGSRVTKYRHRFANVGFGSLEFSDKEIGLLCLLLLRGPQTPGELRQRSSRLCDFDDAHETEAVLQGLADRSDGPFVIRLAREPGRRELRYAHLFGDLAIGDVPAETASVVATEARPRPGEEEGQRIEQLEELVLELQDSLEAVKARLAVLEGRSEE